MAHISSEEVKKLARLSRIALSDEEVERYRKEIESILGFVEQLQAVDTDDVDPTTQVTGLESIMREDALVDYAVGHDDLLKNVPAKESGYIKVKRVLQ